MSKKEVAELEVFDRFARCGVLAIVPGSVRKRSPPEPDIICRVATGGDLAFELIKLWHPGDARIASIVNAFHAALLHAFAALPPASRQAFDVRFGRNAVILAIRRDVPLRPLMALIPTLLEELTSAPQDERRVPVLSKRVTRLVQVNNLLWGRPGGHPFMLLSGAFLGVSTTAFEQKLKNTYKTSCPVHLIAYLEGTIWKIRGRQWLSAIRQAIDTHGLGPFERLWILDNETVVHEYPAGRS